MNIKAISRIYFIFLLTGCAPETTHPQKQPLHRLKNFSLKEQFNHQLYWTLHAKTATELKKENTNAYHLKTIQLIVPLDKKEELKIQSDSAFYKDQSLSIPQKVELTIAPWLTGQIQSLDWSKITQRFTGSSSELKASHFSLKAESLLLDYPYRKIELKKSQATFLY